VVTPPTAARAGPIRSDRNAVRTSASSSAAPIAIVAEPSLANGSWKSRSSQAPYTTNSGSLAMAKHTL
jgi:hypothetical protein